MRTLRLSDNGNRDPRLAAALLSVARHEASILRGHALLMSNAGQHELAEVLMSQAKACIARAK